jgi:hypothetical protein
MPYFPTQVEWTDAFKRLGFFLQSRRRMNYLSDVFSSYKSKVWSWVDPNTTLKDFNLVGIKRGVNTDPSGLLWAYVFDAGGGNRTVDVHKGFPLGGGNKVASGTRAGNGVVTLIEVNNSGLSGVVTLTYTINETLVLILDVAYPKWIDAFEKDLIDKSLADAKSDLDSETQNALEGLVADLAVAQGSLKSVLDSQFFLNFLSNLIDSGETGVWTPRETVGLNGEIVIVRTGVIQDMIESMNGSAPAQKVQENIVAFSAFAPGATNSPDGDFTTTSKVAQQNCRNEKCKIRCIKSLTSTKETFEVSASLTGTMRLRATIGGTYKSLDLGCEFLLDRKITTTSAALTLISVSGETSDSISSEGKIYTRLTNPSGTTRKLECFKHSSRLEAYKVAEGQRDGDGVIVASAYGAFGLTVQATVAYVGDEDAEINLHIVQINDYWEFDLTNDELGVFQTMISRMYPGAVLPASGAPTLDDGEARLPLDPLVHRTGWEGLD